MEDERPYPKILPAAKDSKTVTLPRKKLNAQKKVIPASRIPEAPPASFDLLGSILGEQSKLLMDGSKIQINRDGKKVF